MQDKGKAPQFADIYGFQPLMSAFQRARRAKRGKGSEPEFYINLEKNILQLSRELRTRNYRPDPYRYFFLRKPKERIVSEASFRDRIVHHSLVGALEPVFERIFIEHSYACRKGKGTHRAIKMAKKLSRKFKYYLKLDIEKYFDNIRHDILLKLLSNQVNDQGIIWLCNILMREANVPGVPENEQRGLPIGNLTSQFWANVYLDPSDHIIICKHGVGGYLRYMDDMLLFGNSKNELWKAESDIRLYLNNFLNLQVKQNRTVIAPVTEGIPWLGFRVYSGLIRLDRSARKRFARKLASSQKRAGQSMHSDEKEVSRSASLCGHTVHANCRMLRRNIIKHIDIYC
jgi:retron-type reverse transcriptase